MQAIEFEATTFRHTIRIPDSVPDGVSVRIVLLFDEKQSKSDEDDSRENLLASMPKIGRDEDFSCSTQANKFAAFPAKLKLNRDELNDRKPDYLTMKVEEIEIPPRDERYER